MPLGRRFVKGISPNPGGRRKEVAEVLDGLLALRKDAAKGMKALLAKGLAKLREDDEHEILRDALGIYYRHTKPEALIPDEPLDPFAELSDDELWRALSDERKRRQAAKEEEVKP